MAIFSKCIGVILWCVTWLWSWRISSLLVEWDGSFAIYSIKLTFISVSICNCFWEAIRAWKRSRNCLRIIDAKLFLLTELKAWAKCKFCDSLVIFHEISICTECGNIFVGLFPSKIYKHWFCDEDMFVFYTLSFLGKLWILIISYDTVKEFLRNN